MASSTQLSSTTHVSLNPSSQHFSNSQPSDQVASEPSVGPSESFDVLLLVIHSPQMLDQAQALFKELLRVLAEAGHKVRSKPEPSLF